MFIGVRLVLEKRMERGRGGHGKKGDEKKKKINDAECRVDLTFVACARAIGGPIS